MRRDTQTRHMAGCAAAQIVDAPFGQSIEVLAGFKAFALLDRFFTSFVPYSLNARSKGSE
jgi:hypothetical protein